MRKILIIGLCVALSACSGGRGSGGSAGSAGVLNPFNWFGGGEARRARRSKQAILLPADASDNAVKAGPLIQQITDLRTERTSTGTIIRASGQLASIGYHEVTLVQVPSDVAGLVRFEFRALPPFEVPVIATGRMLDVTAAVYLSTTEYRTVRRVEVIAAQNSRNIRR
ncbi:MAG: hypothetical protein KUG69_13050 [Marinosulfonomonas sp.]|nr:hypothetical protein [Marinosulfonomonas sp.]